MPGADDLSEDGLFPDGIFQVINLQNTVARAKSSLGGGRVFRYPSNHCRLIEKIRMGVVHHENAGEHGDGENDVHHRPGGGDDETLPAGMRHEFAGIAGSLFHGIFARHADVSSQGEQTDPIVGVATLESEQTLAKTNRKNFYANTKKFGGDIVTPFVHQHECAEHDDYTDN